MVKHSDDKSNTNNFLLKSERLKSIESATRAW